MKSRCRRIQLHAWMTTAQQCKRDTVHVKRLAHEEKRDVKVKYRIVVLEVLSRLASADHAVAEFSRPDIEENIQNFSAEHVKVMQRAKETQGSRATQWCWRSYREQRPRTEVLKASADHAVAEFQRQATRCCELPGRGVREASTTNRRSRSSALPRGVGRARGGVRGV